jgi:hypothetical protein
MKKNVLGVLSALVIGSVAMAAPSLIFTEVMSSSGAGGTADWFELTNTSGAAINITGYKFDDGSALFSASVFLNGVTTIAAGESVVFIESAAPGTDIGAFRTFWGGSAATVQIGSYTGAGLGLASGGDGVNVFDTGGAMITGATFGAATNGVSFIYAQGAFTGNSTVLTALSVNSVNGAYTSANGLANIGSPGTFSAIPEPSTYAAILGAVALVAVGVRRKRAGGLE